MDCALPSPKGAQVNDSARLYSCLRCRSQVVICRHCDRGHVYCVECAPLAREEAKNRAATPAINPVTKDDLITPPESVVIGKG